MDTAPLPFRDRLAGEVRAEIARQGLTLVNVADAADIARSSLSRKLAGKQDFKMAELTRVAAVLDIPPSTLVARAEAAEVAA